MDGFSQTDLAKAVATLRSVRERHLSAAIRINGYGEEAAHQAFSAITHHARRLGFAVAYGRGGTGSSGSPLLDALALLIENRPAQRPLLIAMDRLDIHDEFTAGGIRFMSERLAREPVLWLTRDASTGRERPGPGRVACGPIRSILLPALATEVDNSPAGPRVFPPLTPAELRVAQLVCSGSTNAAVASTLGVSSSTVGTHLRSVFHKFQVRSRVQLVNAMRIAS